MERWGKILAVCVTVYITLAPPGAAPVRAQEFRATIVGRVTDTTGAVVPGARVRVANLETNIETVTTTGSGGDYVVPSLLPGRYRMEVDHPGFKKHVREAITLNIHDRTIVDVTLELGDVTSSVTVSADASPLETTTASRGTLVTGRAIVDLPLNGRNTFALALLTPGVNYTSRGLATALLRPSTTLSGLSISGGQPGFNEVLLDGVPITRADGIMNYVPSVDAAQEFKVQTNVFDAEFGRFTGGLLNASTKSGTNAVHGALLEFVRNSAFNARDPFATSKPQFGYNQFGGSIGGPVYLPRYDGRNRTFFFFNYEGLREGVPRAFVNSVPTASQRRGDFSETRVLLPSGAGAPVTIFDPATTRLQGSSYVRDPFPGNVIPAVRFDPVANKMLDFYPEPNAPGDPVTAARNHLLAFKDPVLENGVVVRVDHRFSDRHAVFARYSWRHFYVGRQREFKNEVTGDGEHRRVPGFAFDDTYTLNPKTILNLRYGYARALNLIRSDNTGYDLAKLGFPEQFVRTLDVLAIPRVEIAGLATLSSPTKVSRLAQDTHSFKASVTRIAGPHALRFGAESRVLRVHSWSSGNAAAGSFAFNSVFTRGPNPQVSSVTGGLGLASFLLGLAASGSVAKNGAMSQQVPYYGLYLQDDFRVTSKITLNLGLRYEFEGPNTERFNRFNRGFDFNSDSPLAPQAKANYAANPMPGLPPDRLQVKGGLLFAGVNGMPRAMTDLDLNNLAPRIGVAWTLTPKTVLRAGYGSFFGGTTALAETANGFSISAPFVGTIDGGLTAVNTLRDPFPEGVPSPPGSSLGLLTLVGQGVNYVDTARQQPFSHQYQFGIQRELPGAVLAEVAYSGSAGRHMAVDVSVNAIPAAVWNEARQTFVASKRNPLTDSAPNPFYQLIASGPLSGRTTTRGQLFRPYPHFTSITQLNHSIGTSRFDSLQAKVVKRMAGGVQLVASYSLMKLLQRLSYQNEQDPFLTKQLAAFDIPQRLVVSVNYELPLGGGRRWLAASKGLLGKLVEGYQINVIYTAQSGVPLVVSGAESLGRSAKIQRSTVERWFDTSAFRQRETLEYVGTSLLPDVRSHGKNNFDASLLKTVQLAEELRLQFRAEAFNALNRPEYASPNGTFGNPNFGRVTASNAYNRQLQLALKLLW